MNRPISFEPLEPRQLLSVTLHDGLLKVTGTRRSDDIVIYVNDATAADGLVVLVQHRQALRCNPASVRRISIDLGLADDHVSFSAPGLDFRPVDAPDVPVTVRGGGGNDTLSGSTHADLLDGGDGDDLLLPQSGNNTVLGGAGNDAINAYDGNNLLRGGSGDDAILALHAGNNILYGDGGHDLLTGGDGNDTLMGGPNADTLDGGLGYDRIYGNRGDDTFFATNDSPRQRKDLQPHEALFNPPVIVPHDPILVVAPHTTPPRLHHDTSARVFAL
jgi:Ca2+-binding RTX toxin-like protein